MPIREDVKLHPNCFLQAIDVLPYGEKGDVEIYGQSYNIPKSGQTPVIDSGNSSYKYDFSTKEIVLISTDGKEVYRKQVNPVVFAKNEFKWIRLTKEEASVVLGLDSCY